MKASFSKELQRLLNRTAQENASCTPDFVLARYLVACLKAWNTGVQQREAWYGCDVRPYSKRGKIQLRAKPQ